MKDNKWCWVNEYDTAGIINDNGTTWITVEYNTYSREDIDELVAAILQVRNKTDGEAEKLLKDKGFYAEQEFRDRFYKNVHASSQTTKE